MRSALLRLLAFASIQSSRAASLLAHAVGGATTLAELRRAIGRGWNKHGQSVSAAEPSLFDWEAEFYRAHIPPASRVLLVGCGAGRDLIALAGFGHRVDGLDIAREALAACQIALEQRGIAARLYESAVEEARIEAQYDAVVFTWLGYAYIPGREARIGTLRTLRGILRPIPSLLESAPIASCLETLMRERSHIALVRDARGDVRGLLTLEDIIEELVGEIEDEYDRLPTHIVPSGPGWLVGGVITLGRLREATGIDLAVMPPAEGTQRLSDWACAQLGGKVQGGEIFERAGLRLIVRKVRRQKVQEAYLSVLGGPP